LGKAAALSLAKEGCQVLVCARSEKNFQKPVDQIRTISNSKVYSAIFDVKDKDALSSFISTTHEQFGSIDILVTNACRPGWSIKRNFISRLKTKLSGFFYLRMKFQRQLNDESRSFTHNTVN
jgi:NADP-dependent 3-hydroxy acid dehydrogenase YdfG